MSEKANNQPIVDESDDMPDASATSFRILLMISATVQAISPRKDIAASQMYSVDHFLTQSLADDPDLPDVINGF